MSTDSPTSPWVAAIATATLALLVSAVGYTTLKQEMRIASAQDKKNQHEALSTITARVEKLETSPVADPANKATIEAITGPLQERIIALEAQLSAANARIETLEKIPAPVVAEPVAIVTPPAPAAVAEPAKPIITDAERLAQFKTILASLPAPHVQAEGAAKTINERFAGLITIKKSVPDSYAPLRDAQSIAHARAAIATLPLEQQAPFASWMQT